MNTSTAPLEDFRECHVHCLMIAGALRRTLEQETYCTDAEKRILGLALKHIRAAETQLAEMRAREKFMGATRIPTTEKQAASIK